MPTIAQPTKHNYEPTPQGTHIARLYSIIHIGTTGYDFMGEWKESYKIRLTFELPNKTKVFDEKKGAQPMVISEEYGLTMGSKSKLRKVVEGIIDHQITDQEAYAFDIEDLLGEPCLVRVIHKTKGDKTYANIESVSPLMEGQVCPPQVNPNFVFTFNDLSKLDTLPEFIQEKIKGTGEYRGKMAVKKNAGLINEVRNTMKREQDYPEETINPDEIPF